MERRRAAVLAANVVGYSRLLRVQSERALTRISADRQEVIEPTLAQHNGRIIRSSEETTLMEFPHAIDAVAFAVEMQRTIQTRNTCVIESRRVAYRVGIDTGTISGEAAETQGEPVKAAADLEKIADLGGICLSKAVFDQIRKKLDLTFKPMTDRTVKDSTEPLSAIAVLLDQKAETFTKPADSGGQRRWAVAAATAIVIILAAGLLWWQPWVDTESSVASNGESFALPEKPSIAVLPFENLTTGDENQMFADGMTTAIIAALAQVPDLFVTARNSVFAYKGQATDVREVGRVFGVRYILDGTLQVSNDRVRVTVEMADATTGETIWAERYDRETDDVFALQDEIALRVLVSLQVQLKEGFQAAVRGASTDNVEAYVRFVKARDLYRTITKEAMAEVRRLVDEIIELDPNFRQALVLKSRSHALDARFGYSTSAEQSLEQAIGILNKAAILDGHVSDPERGEILIVEAYIELVAGRFDEAVETGERAVAAGPNNADLVATQAMILFFDRKFDRSISLLRRAIHLSPTHPSWYALYLSRGYAFTGDTENAIQWARNSVDRAESDYVRAINLANLAFVYELAGLSGEAKRAAAQALAEAPDFTISSYRPTQRYRHEEDWERYADALRAAGIPG